MSKAYNLRSAHPSPSERRLQGDDGNPLLTAAQLEGGSDADSPADQEGRHDEPQIKRPRLNPVDGEYYTLKAAEQPRSLERAAPSRVVEVGNGMREANDPRVATVRAYHRARTIPNLLRLLNVAGDVEGLGAITNRLEACTQRAKGQKRHRCGFYGCPSCGSKLAKKESLDALKMIVAKHGLVPDTSQASFVTIRGAQTELKPGPVVALMKSLGTRIRKSQMQVGLRQTSWIGWMDVSFKGVVHWHGVVLHHGISRRILRERLEVQFRAPRAVMVKAWDRDTSLTENILNVLQYSLPAARHTKMKKGKPVYGMESPKLIAERLVCLGAMTRIGVRGIRLKLNMISSRSWKAGVMFDRVQGETIVVPEMERLILERRRRARRAQTAWFGKRSSVKAEGRELEIRNEERVRVCVTVPPGRARGQCAA